MSTVTLDSYRREDIGQKKARQHLHDAEYDAPEHVKAAAVEAAAAALREWRP